MPTHFLTLTANPALDWITQAPVHAIQRVQRCAPAQLRPGGGGIQVARTLHALGERVQAWHLSGGPHGRELEILLDAEQLSHRRLPVAGDTRTNFTVRDPSSGQAWRWMQPGPHLSEPEWQACLDALRALPMAPRWVVASGSLPPGVPADFYRRVAEWSMSRGSRCVVDGPAEALLEPLARGVYLAKLDRRSLHTLTGAALDTPEQCRAAAQSLVRQGAAQIVLLSLEAEGAVLAQHDRSWQALPPQTPGGRDTPGTGAAGLAGLLRALEHGLPPEQALRWGLATAAAYRKTSQTPPLQAHVESLIATAALQA